MSSTTATSISWDGLALDPRPFARLNEKGTLTCGKKTVGNAGARVVELEGHADGGMFGRPATGPGRIQWTVEQETSRLLEPENPFKQIARDGGSVHVERPYFDSVLAVVPKVKVVRPPTCIPRAGPQADCALLTPEERREINEYEVRMQAAERVGRKAQFQKARLDFIMKHRYPEGSIGVDSPFNPASEVHAEKRVARDKREAASSVHAAARRRRLDEIRGNPRPRFGYDPWHHPDLPVEGGIQQGLYGGKGGGDAGWGDVKPVQKNGGEHFLQTKVRMGQDPGDPSVIPAGSPTKKVQVQQLCPDGSTGCFRSETYRNILGMREKTPKADPSIRAQALWDEGSGRRPYSIISGVQLPLRTAKAERPPGRLMHPSQQSLERGRNLQASLIPV